VGHVGSRAGYAPTLLAREPLLETDSLQSGKRVAVQVSGHVTSPATRMLAAPVLSRSRREEDDRATDHGPASVCWHHAHSRDDDQPWRVDRL